MTAGGIYIIINEINSKMYIGSTISFRKRKTTHFSLLKNNRHFNFHLQNAYNKYGDVFFFGVIEYVKNNENLIPREQYWMDHYGSYDSGIGYNISKIAGRPSPFIHSDEQLAEMSRRMSGENNPMYGRTHSSEAKEKISRVDKSYSKTDEFKDKMSKVTSGANNGMYGRKHSKETKEKISKIAKERDISGDGNPNSKIPVEEHEKIRYYLKNKIHKGIELAEFYGVDPNTISSIKNKRGVYDG